MEYSDLNQYRHQLATVTEINTQHPELIAALPDDERTSVEEYFIGASQSDDVQAYRSDILKADATYELRANKAYEALLVASGRSEMSESNYRQDRL